MICMNQVEEESIQSYGSTSRLAKRVCLMATKINVFCIDSEYLFKCVSVRTYYLQVIACLDVRSNEKGDLVVTKGDQYDVRDKSDNREVSFNWLWFSLQFVACGKLSCRYVVLVAQIKLWLCVGYNLGIIFQLEQKLMDHLHDKQKSMGVQDITWERWELPQQWLRDCFN